jgi:hypothetical protein
MATPFACPSPRGSNNAGLFLTKPGTLVDKHGRSWGASSIRRMALDAALPDANAERDHEHRGNELHADMQKLVDEFDLHDEVADAVMSLLAKHFPPQSKRGPGPDATRGAGARDRRRGADARDDRDDDGLAEFRKHLAAKGLNADEIAEACEIAKRDREDEATDRLPANAIHGGMHGYRSGVSKHATDADLEAEFAGIEYTSRDVYGEPVSERERRDTVRERGVRLGGDRAFDAELEQLIANVKVGAFG